MCSALNLHVPHPDPPRSGDNSKLLSPLPSSPFTMQLLYEVVATILVGPEAFNESKALYPYPTPVPADLRLFASTLLTDGLFLCPSRNASEALQATQPFRRSKAYHYEFEHVMSWAQQVRRVVSVEVVVRVRARDGLTLFSPPSTSLLLPLHTDVGP